MTDMFPDFLNYQVERCLQQSNQNATLQARNAAGEQILIRMVRRSVLSDSWLLRMEHEVKKLREIRNRHYSSPVAMGSHEGWTYLTYQQIAGDRLSTILAANRLAEIYGSRVQAVLSIAEDCLKGLCEVHDAGFVHRDLRPSHLLRESNRGLVVGGFGPICLADAFGHHGEQAVEFARYASPELAGSIDQELTPSSDLYSLGVLLFQCLIGRPPFDGDDIGEILFQHLTKVPEYSELCGDTPDVLIQLIDRMLQKEVRDRYQSATSVLSDVYAIQEALARGQGSTEVAIGRFDNRSELTEPSFVGRASEMGVIEDQLKQVACGEQRTIIAVSKSGMGKSRLLLEAMRCASRRGFRIFRSVASDQATQEPLGPVLNIIDGLAKQLSYNERERDLAREELKEYQGEIATAMPALAKSLGWSDLQLSGPEEAGQGRITLAFCKTLTYCGLDRPTLICIDDCQWLDQPSLRILEAFAKARPAKVCLLIGSRPAEGVSEQVLAALGEAQLLHFGELDEEGIHSLAESMAGPLPDMVKAAVAGMSEGSPFLATAAIRGLVESGAMVPAPLGWRIVDDKFHDFQAAGDSANILLKRMQFVDAGAVELLSIGAVIGKQFDLRISIALSELDPEDAFRKLQSVRDQGLVWSKPNGTIAFVHDKIREAFLQTLPANFKRQLHQRVAEYLVERDPTRCFDLAHHFDEAALPNQAWPHALRAANEARSRYALETAESHFRIALRAVVETDPRSAMMPDNGQPERAAQHQIQSGLAKVLLLLGKYEEAEHLLSAALESASTPLEESEVRFHQGELAFKRGDKQLALERFEKALSESGQFVPKRKITLLALLSRELVVQTLHSLLPKVFIARRTLPSEEVRLVWKLYSKLAHCYWYVRDKYYTFWAHLSELNEAELYQPTPELAQAYSEHAPGMSLIPWPKRGLDYARRSLVMRKQNGDLWGQGQSRNFLSIMFYSGARFEECMNQAHQAISVLERTGDYWEIHMAQYQAAASLYRLGRLREALDATKALYESAIRRGDHQSSGNAMDLWARASLGRVPDEILDLESSRKVRDHQGRCQVLLARGVQSHFAGQYDHAIECFSSAIAEVRQTGVMNAYITPNYAWLATSLRCRFQAETPLDRKCRQRAIVEITRAARRALWVARRFRNELPHAYREMAAAEAFRGRTHRALKLLEKSLRIANAQGAEYEFVQSETLKFRLLSELQVSPLRLQGLQECQQKLAAFESEIRDNHVENSLSLIDRFEVLLDAGREINASMDVATILKRTREAAQRLLRGDRLLIISAQQDSEHAAFELLEPVGSSEDFDPQIVLKALSRGAATIEHREQIDRHGTMLYQQGAFLACPIDVYGQPRYVLYVANSHVQNLYGVDEARIANYLASTASGALERADGFTRLEQLNANLENRVQERTAAVVQRSRDLERVAHELRATQVELEQAKTAAERASASKSEFLACMSHEIRTPMSAVLGFTELLRTRDVPQQERDKYLKRIHTNGQHLLSLLNSVLDFSKIESGHLEIERVSFMPVELISDAVSSLAGRAEEKGLGLELTTEGSLPEFIISDPTRLRQIMINLLGNAIKFTERGFVRVEVSLEQEHPEPQLVIRVSDSGIGIPKEKIANIFDPFTQADASTTRNFGGTGLGLSITKRLAEALGGSIELDSQLGSGSQFAVRIATGPLDEITMLDGLDTPEEKAVEIRNANDCLSGLRVLVVDDVEENRELAGFLLKESGAQVVFSSNGNDALSLLKQAPVDVVVMDMQMPLMDGYAATREIRGLGYEIPVVAMTASNLPGDRERCHAAGCNAFVPKPLDFEHLVETLRLQTQEIDRPLTASKEESEAAAQQSVAHQRPPESPRTIQDAEKDLDALMEQLAGSFLEEVLERWEEIETAVAKHDITALKKIAHWIRGTGATFGFKELESCMCKLEAAIQNSQFEQLQPIFNEFSSAFQDALTPTEAVD